MPILLKTYWQIALLRVSPQRLPASQFLLGATLFVHWLIGVVLGLVAGESSYALFVALIGTLSMVALVHGVLVLHGRSARALQTVTAIAGSEALLGILAIPVTVWFVSGGPGRDLAALFSLLLLGWNVAVVAHVLRHALSTTQATGFVYAIGYMFFSLAIAGAIAPAGG